jgi:hypothetical protein
VTSLARVGLVVSKGFTALTPLPVDIPYVIASCRQKDMHELADIIEGQKDFIRELRVNNKFLQARLDAAKKRKP